MHLTLLIPELVWSNPDDRSIYDGLDAGALAALLAGAPPAVAPALANEDWLADRFGLAPPAPIAALRCAGDGLDPGDADWICADPVHLRFHQERLVLADESQIGLSVGEAEALMATLNTQLGEAGEFVAATPQRWALRLKAPVTHAWPPLSQAIGREVQLAALLADPQLKRLGHETQMLLHGHPVNTARAAAGRTTVNALWFWGAGARGAAPAAPGLRLYSATPVGRGLARLATVPLAPPPSTLAQLLAGGGNGDALVELDALALPASYENSADYLAAWQRLDRDWFAGLASALRRGRIRTLSIVAPSAFGLLTWSLGRLAAWRWRPSRKRLSTTIRQLVEKDRR